MADFNLFWKDKDSDAGIIGTYFNAENMGIVHPSVNSLNEQFIVPAPSNNRGFVLKGGTFIKILQPDGSGGYNHLVFGSDADTVVAYTEQRLDTGVSFTPGRDYYIYLCLQAPAKAGQLPTATLVVSLNSTFPSGYNADNSRKIGGFHTLCLAVGSISGHPLSGMNAGDILPASFWDLWHRPTCSPEGMVYVSELDFWADIYLQSGSGANTRSYYGGTITDNQTYSQHIEDLFKVGKNPLSDEEFQCAAEGSNQKTNIQGSADPVTTGGHLNTAGRRMISNYGLEDCAGAMWQWLSGWGTRIDAAPFNVWTEDANKGSVIYTTALLAGGHWDNGAYCGSRCRYAGNSRFGVYANDGCRGRARSRATR